MAAPWALLIALPAVAAGQESQASRPLAAGGLVAVQAQAHDVRVEGWDREEVTVSGDAEGLPEGLRVEGGGDRVTVRLDPDWVRERNGRTEVRVDVERERPGELLVRMPRSARLQLHGMAGDLVVEGVDGSVDLQTHAGDLTYTGGAANVQAVTFSGDVQVVGSSRKTTVKAVNGDVLVRVAGGYLRAESVSGDIEVEATGPVETGILKTVSGDVVFRGGIAADATLDLEAHSGDVVATIPADTDARFDVGTFSGDVENALGPAAREVSRYTSEKRVQFTLGTGRARVGIHTFSGDVRLVSR